jgi:hypothetical protein
VGEPRGAHPVATFDREGTPYWRIAAELYDRYGSGPLVRDDLRGVHLRQDRTYACCAGRSVDRLARRRTLPARSNSTTVVAQENGEA